MYFVFSPPSWKTDFFILLYVFLYTTSSTPNSGNIIGNFPKFLFLQQQLGDLIYVTHDALNLNEEPYTLIGKQIDIDSQTITMELSVGHGLAVGNFTIFELDDTELGVLDSDAGKLA